MRRFLVSVLLVASPTVVAASLQPLTNPIALSVPERHPAAPAVASDGGARYAVVWRDSTAEGVAILAHRFDGLTGTTVGPDLFVRLPEPGIEISDPKVAMDAAGRLAVVWGEKKGDVTCLKSWRLGGDTLLSPFLFEPCRTGVPLVHPAIAYGKGRFVVAWERQTATGPARLAAQRYDESGAPFEGPLTLTQTGESGGSAIFPAVASDANGSFSVAWEVRYSSGRGQVVERSYNRAGQARNAGAVSNRGAISHGAAVAAGADRAAFAFESEFEPNRSDVALLWHPEARLAAVSELFIPADGFIESTAVGTPSLAMDYQGRMALAWTCVDRFDEPTSRLCATNYTRRGVYKGGFLGFDDDESAPSVAFGRGGLLAAWLKEGPGGTAIAAQLFGVFRQDELCVYRQNRFHCGAFFLVQEVLAFGSGIARGDRPLLADLDGNGDQDPCVFRAGQFLCDTGHDGGNPDLVRRFGRAGDTPLAGDLNGDGRDDACVHRGRAFLCDTAGNGGSPEVTIGFGLVGDLPILADTDGDGRDDPCVYRRGVKSFLCDWNHDGLRDLTVVLPDALPNDKPLIADFGGSGTDGFFCVVRGTQLLCRNGLGGLEPIAVNSLAGGDFPMIGDIDGF
jgi:hypothetical protein